MNIFLLKNITNKNKVETMESETSKMHQKESSKNITCGVITLSDSRKSEKLDLSGKYISE